MRDIKFRAWQIQMDEMYYNVNPIFHKNGELDFLVYEYSNTGYDMVEINIEKYDSTTVYDEGVLPVILMQYTGLKDKNGVDIYEGDIVDVSNLLTVPNCIKTDVVRGVVVFLEGAWLVENVSEKIAIPVFSETNKIEVIGNIYENKGLLEGE